MFIFIDPSNEYNKYDICNNNYNNPNNVTR